MGNEQPIEKRPQRWSIRFAVEGDLRFLSHLDVLRAIERTAARARLPLRYSQGFNPRPKISAPHPRPVGVATRRDLLVLETDCGPAPEQWLERLNRHAPRGMRFFEAKRLEVKQPPRVRKASYELPLSPDRAGEAKDRLRRLRRLDTWQVERLSKASPRRAGRRTRRIDIKPLVETLEIEGHLLRLVLIRGGDMWARPGEVLRVLGMEEDLAGLIRTTVECET